jgi:hypothetical protein
LRTLGPWSREREEDEAPLPPCPEPVKPLLQRKKTAVD